MLRFAFPCPTLTDLLRKKAPCQTLATIRVNGRAELVNGLGYLTTSVALPPLLLRTVMFCGFTGHVNSARNLPPPWFESVPINWLFEVTNTCSVAFALLLVASTRSLRLPVSYSARVIATESGAGVACGVTVRPTLRVTPPELPLKVTGVRAATCLVVILTVLSTNPAGIVAVTGTFATFGLLLLNCTTTPPAGAPESRLTMPRAVAPPLTVEGETVTAAS